MLPLLNVSCYNWLRQVKCLTFTIKITVLNRWVLVTCNEIPTIYTRRMWFWEGKTSVSPRMDIIHTSTGLIFTNVGFDFIWNSLRGEGIWATSSSIQWTSWLKFLSNWIFHQIVCAHKPKQSKTTEKFLSPSFFPKAHVQTMSNSLRELNCNINRDQIQIF